MKETERKCNKCGETKGLDQFPKTGKNYRYHKRDCRTCVYAYYRERYSSSEEIRASASVRAATNAPKYKKYRTYWATFSVKGIYQRLKSRTKKLELGQLLSQEEFIQWYLGQDKKCFYCDVPELLAIPELFMGHYKLSIDRLDPNVGYVKGNLNLCCSRCNSIKNNFFSPSDMRDIAQRYVKPRWLNH